MLLVMLMVEREWGRGGGAGQKTGLLSHLRLGIIIFQESMCAPVQSPRYRGEGAGIDPDRRGL